MYALSLKETEPITLAHVLQHLEIFEQIYTA
jgi:hypothetical protein